MCIAAIAWQLFDEMPLILLSNRDEFYDRPTTPAHQWEDAPIYAGRDNKSGGTWLGIHQHIHSARSDIKQSGSKPRITENSDDDLSTLYQQNGRWAAVLNYRDGVQASEDQRSRGELVTNFLTSQLSPLDFVRQLDLRAYAGFNLIVGNAKQAVVVNNRGYPPTPLHNGLHILSNGQPECDWFKCERLRGRVRQEVLPLISESFEFHDGDLEYWMPAAWSVLSDRIQAPTDQLPDTGISLELEEALSAVCIDAAQMPEYGTRTQSILTLSVDQNIDSSTQVIMPELSLISREYAPKNSKLLS